VRPVWEPEGQHSGERGEEALDLRQRRSAVVLSRAERAMVWGKGCGKLN
jgi:hypothetical protein